MVGPLRLSPVVELNKQNLGLEQQRQHHRPALRRTKAVEVEQRGMSSSSKEKVRGEEEEEGEGDRASSSSSSFFCART